MTARTSPYSVFNTPFTAGADHHDGHGASALSMRAGILPAVAHPRRLNPGFSLVRDGYRILIADDSHAFKSRIARLVERMYVSRGLMSYHREIEPDHRQTTIVACRDDHPFATLTLGLETEDGLMADALYKAEVDSVRDKGGRVCEVSRLAMDPDHGSQEVFGAMVQVLYVLVRMVHRLTDIFIEVHPRHAPFYKRLLGCSVAGPERTCPRVGAPAVLMHLPGTTIDALFSDPGAREHATRSLYRSFAAPAELFSLHRQLVAH
jgi:hypothetical protein